MQIDLIAIQWIRCFSIDLEESRLTNIDHLRFFVIRCLDRREALSLQTSIRCS